MRRTKRGRRLYAKRNVTVQSVFGQIKQGRGLRPFLLRGHPQVCGEWALICTTHTVLKLWRSTTRRRPVPSVCGDERCDEREPRSRRIQTIPGRLSVC